jgi:two-component system, NtrC family, sensor histidine kinase KinB
LHFQQRAALIPRHFFRNWQEAMVQTWTRLALAVGGMALLAAGAVAAAQGGIAWAGWVLLVLALAAGGVATWVAYRACRRMQETTQQQLEALRGAHRLELHKSSRAKTAAQAVIDLLPHAVALVSPDGRIEMTNEGGRMFGLKLGLHMEEVPHPWFKKIVSDAMSMPGPGSTAEAPPAPVATNERNGGDQDALVQMFSEGRELFFRPQATPLMDDEGQFLGVIVILMDVTAVRQVDEAKSSLLSSFSHELKTPMTSLQMSIYLLLDDAASRLTPRQLELLNAARDDADRLHRLVEEVLSAARKKL